MLARVTLVSLLAVMSARSAVAAENPAVAAENPAAGAVAPPAAAPARATPVAEAAGESAAPTGRILAGHVFMPSAAVSGPLVTTSFGSYLLLGYGTTTGSLQAGDRTFEGTFDYAGVGGALAYEYAFTPNISARFTLQEAMYSGINGRSIVVVGTSVVTGFGLGVTASLPLGDSLRLGLLLDASQAPGFALTIGQGIKAVIDSCNAGDCNLGNTEEIFALNNAQTLQPALAMSWVPWRPLGITANAAYLYVTQKQNDGTFKGQTFSLGVAADLDLFAVWRVPIGLQAIYSWTGAVSNTSIDAISNLGGGIFYTGREHVSVGLQVVARRFAVQPTLRTSWSTQLATLGVRYFW